MTWNWNSGEGTFCLPPREALYLKNDCESSNTKVSVLRHFGIYKNVLSFNTISMKI
jgi:hypothetical protein